MNRLTRNLLALAAALGLASGVVGCSDSNNAPPVSPPPPPPPAPLTVGGVVSDGAVVGGSLFLFLPEDVQAALDSIDPAGDRLAALTAASAVTSLTRDPADEATYLVTVDNANASRPVFLVFDNTDAEDETFGDTPANLESVVVLGDAGSAHRVNVSLQTTLIAQQVRMTLDPDGDGTVTADAEIATAIDDATASILSAFPVDALGRDLYPPGFDPVSHDDDGEVHAASTALGTVLRAAGFLEDTGNDEIVAILAADAADGTFDGNIPVSLGPSPEDEALAEAIHDVATAGSDEDIAVFAVGPCSSAAVAMQRACAVDVVDDFFEGAAVCTDIADDDDRAECLADVEFDTAEREEECDDTFDARLALCEELADAAHEPAFGESFAASFVDPLTIGGATAPNPWFPLVPGNRWLYAGDGESIEVMVTSETKLIDGITCIVVVDTASEDGAVVEVTRDWYAQDVSGNVWYCGEIARNFELFEGDDPEIPELVDIDGSWKSGRDGAEAGMLLPFDPVVDQVIRQEVAYGEAEDVVRIESLTATESSPGGACSGDCLMTADFTPLEPDVEENKYYVPGIGLIVEIDLETGDRVELEEFTQMP
jgi:hypothetical protein